MKQHGKTIFLYIFFVLFEKSRIIVQQGCEKNVCSVMFIAVLTHERQTMRGALNMFQLYSGCIASFSVLIYLTR